jgi:hypothetical protein
VVEGERTIYESYTIEIFDSMTPSHFTRTEWDIAYVLTLHMSVHSRVRSILKIVENR